MARRAKVTRDLSCRRGAARTSTARALPSPKSSIMPACDASRPRDRSKRMGSISIDVDATALADDGARQGAAVTRFPYRAPEMVTRTELEEPEGEKVRVRRTHRRAPCCIERHRRVVGTRARCPRAARTALAGREHRLEHVLVDAPELRRELGHEGAARLTARLREARGRRRFERRAPEERAPIGPRAAPRSRHNDARSECSRSRRASESRRASGRARAPDE